MPTDISKIRTISPAEELVIYRKQLMGNLLHRTRVRHDDAAGSLYDSLSYRIDAEATIVRSYLPTSSLRKIGPCNRPSWHNQVESDEDRFAQRTREKGKTGKKLQPSNFLKTKLVREVRHALANKSLRDKADEHLKKWRREAAQEGLGELQQELEALFAKPASQLDSGKNDRSIAEQVRTSIADDSNAGEASSKQVTRGRRKTRVSIPEVLHNAGIEMKGAEVDTTDLKRKERVARVRERRLKRAARLPSHNESSTHHPADQHALMQTSSNAPDNFLAKAQPVDPKTNFVNVSAHLANSFIDDNAGTSLKSNTDYFVRNGKVSAMVSDEKMQVPSLVKLFERLGK